MSWLNILIIVTLPIYIIGGIFIGFIRDALNLIGLIFGILLAIKFFEPVSKWLSFISNTQNARIIAFIAIVIITLIIAWSVGKLLCKLIKVIKMAWLDRLLGGILGLFTWAFTWGIMLCIFVSNSYINTDEVSAMANLLIGNFGKFYPGIFEFIINYIGN